MPLFWKFDCISEGLISSAPVPTTGGYIAMENPDQERFLILEHHSNLRGTHSPQHPGNRKSDQLPGEWISKCVSSKTLFDAGGRLLSLNAAGLATTWRTHHAFSARCRMVSSPKAVHSAPGIAPTDDTISERKEKISDSIHTRSQGLPFKGTPLWMPWRPRLYREWKIDLYIRSVCADPHILVSVAPHYFVYGGTQGPSSNGEERLHLPTVPNDDDENALIWPCNMENKIKYDKRMLETPLVYEEPYTVSVEFGSKGTLLWSDQWERYGERVSDRCLQPFFSEEDSLFQAFSPLSFVRPSFDQERGVVVESTIKKGRTTEGAPLGYQGLVRLQWSTLTPHSDAQLHGNPEAILSVFFGVSPPRTTQSSELNTPSEAIKNSQNELGISYKDIEWQHACDATLQLDSGASNLLFVPYITLLECGDEALIFN